MRNLIPLVFALFVIPIFAQKAATTKITPSKISCDCKDAVKIDIGKSAKYGETLPPKGFGSMQEITAQNKSDKLNFEQEHNSAWYLLTLNFDGEFVFEIIPKDSSDDYDFLVYKYTDSGFCNALLKKQIKPVRSNLSRDDKRLKGYTGLSVDAKNEFVGTGVGQAWTKSMQVTKDDKYVLVLDNVYPDGKGHTIKFNYIKQVTISGTITGQDSLPMKAEVVLSDNNGTTVKQFNTGEDGKYSFTAGLKEGLDYSIVLSTENSFIETKIINTTQLQTQPASFTDIRTVLTKLKKGERYNVKNINFEGSSDVLLYESYPSVEALYKLMKKNKKMVIRIEGHVHGYKPKHGYKEDPVRQQLSELRAKKVYDYLVKKGIEKERLQTTGFGDRVLLYPNARDHREASANRRVEINVLSID